MSTDTGSSEAHILDGVRILDLTTGIAGPYCSKLLADAGADVVKVETGGADPLRAWGSGALFEFLNASKRSVTTDEGLAEGADVILSNAGDDVGPTPPGEPRRRRRDDHALRSRRPMGGATVDRVHAPSGVRFDRPTGASREPSPGGGRAHR